MNKKTRVLQVVGSMNTGGAEVMLMDIFRHLSNNTEFSFLINYKKKTGVTKGDFDDEIISKGAQIKHIATQWDLGHLQYIKTFKEIYNNLNRPEVVHIHLNAKSGLIALAAKLAGAKKIIVHSHANIVFRGNPFKVKIYQFETFFQKILINKYATDYWGASNEAIESLFFKSKTSQAVVINNAVDTNKFQEVTDEQITTFKKSLKIDKNTMVLGNVGRVVRHKNVSFIIDVLHKLEQTHPDFIFIFAGRKDDNIYFKEIEKKINKYNLQKKVIHLGNRDDIPTIINAMDVFIAPALQEGFGLVAVEAQAAGVPCVLYKGFPNLVDMNLGLVKILSELNVDIWKKTIISNTNNKLIDKEQIKKMIRKNGFDIIENTRLVEDYYATHFQNNIVH